MVGTGGTGSHVITQLAHLGVRKLLLIDPDTIEESNLPRLIGASLADIGKLKAEVLAAAARTISRGAASASPGSASSTSIPACWPRRT